MMMMFLLFDAIQRFGSNHIMVSKKLGIVRFGGLSFCGMIDAALSCGDDCCVLFNEKQRALRPLALS